MSDTDRTRDNALDHSDCVTRSEFNRLRDATDRIHREALRGWSEAVDRAERAEASNARLCEALDRCQGAVGLYDAGRAGANWVVNAVRAALTTGSGVRRD